MPGKVIYPSLQIIIRKIKDKYQNFGRKETQGGRKVGRFTYFDIKMIESMQLVSTQDFICIFQNYSKQKYRINHKTIMTPLTQKVIKSYFCVERTNKIVTAQLKPNTKLV